MKKWYKILSLFIGSMTFGTQAMQTTSHPAIEMCVGDVCLMKNIAYRSYEIAQYDHGAGGGRQGGGGVNFIRENLNGIDWEVRPFYEQPRQTQSAVGTVYYSANPSALIVAFHGSYWMHNWVTNFTFSPRSASHLCNALAGNVHKGFSTIVENSYADMMSKIEASLGRNIQQDDTIYFTGHSLGGALTTLASAAISSNNIFHSNHIKVIAFSTPRQVIGDAEFVKCYSEKISSKNILNFSCKADIVPHATPPGLGYRPLGINIEVTPIEQLNSYYNQPLPQNLDEAWRHSWWVPAGMAFSYFMGSWFTIPTTIVGGFKTFHAAPSDETIKKALNYTQHKYYTSTSSIEEVGEFPLFTSVERNFFLKRLY